VRLKGIVEEEALRQDNEGALWKRFLPAFRHHAFAVRQYTEDWEPNCGLTEHEYEYWKPLYRESSTLRYDRTYAEKDIKKAVRRLRTDAKDFGKDFFGEHYTPHCIPL
jgi:hypothetical protein